MQLYDGLKAPASAVQPYPVTNDCLVTVYQDGENWRAEAPIEVSRAWSFEAPGKYTLRFGGAPSLNVAARAAGGIPTVKGFQLTAETFAIMLGYFGIVLTLPTCFADRPILVTQARGGLDVRVPAEDGDSVTDWARDKQNWTLLVRVPTAPADTCDELIRVVSPESWFIRTRDGRWCEASAPSVKNVLQSEGYSKPDAEVIMGHALRDAWTMVSRPFTCEYPDRRTWNKHAPQLRYKPRYGDCPTWLRVLEHLGRDLDSAVREADLPTVTTGASYLEAWMAAIVQKPSCRMPFLFFWSPEQDSGKSSFHESFELLVTRGVVKADRVLTSTSGFNGELQGAVLAVVEETDLSKSAVAYARIKDLTTSLNIQIRALYRSPFDVENCTHWCQTANSPGACPIEVGDSRVVSIRVDPLATIIPKHQLQAKLVEEAPAFIHRLVHFPLPRPIGRLALPPLETASKRATIEANKPALVRVVEELLATSTEWQGSASQLRAIDRECPGDFRRLQSELAKSELYLKAAKIEPTFPNERGLHGKQVRFRRTA